MCVTRHKRKKGKKATFGIVRSGTYEPFVLHLHIVGVRFSHIVQTFLECTLPLDPRSSLDSSPGIVTDQYFQISRMRKTATSASGDSIVA